MKELTTILPHRAPLLLIDKVLENSPEKLVAGLTIHKNSYGFQEGSVPGWFGVEYMAQTIAAFNGLNFGGKENSRPEIGFLIGVRNYKTTLENFPENAELKVSVVPGFVVDKSGSFDCKISIGDDVVAESVIIAYMPDNSFIEKLKGENHE